MMESKKMVSRFDFLIEDDFTEQGSQTGKK